MRKNGGIKLKAIYKPNEFHDEKVRIIGKKFFEKNKLKGVVVYNNKQYKLKEYIEDIDINYNHKSKFEIIFFLVDNFLDVSYLFSKCKSLISLSELYEESMTNDIPLETYKDFISDKSNISEFYEDNLNVFDGVEGSSNEFGCVDLDDNNSVVVENMSNNSNQSSISEIF